jgi:hypothetical protein
MILETILIVGIIVGLVSVIGYGSILVLGKVDSIDKRKVKIS